MSNAKYKVGQQVRIRKDLSGAQHYDNLEDGQEGYAGETAVIKKIVNKTRVEFRMYYLDSCGDGSWYEDELEPLEEAINDSLYEVIQ